jgi:hypothetical protein
MEWEGKPHLDCGPTADALPPTQESYPPVPC